MQSKLDENMNGDPFDFETVEDGGNLSRTEMEPMSSNGEENAPETDRERSDEAKAEDLQLEVCSWRRL